MVPDLRIRVAEESDVAEIAAIFATDELGGHGDTADPIALPDYMAAFRKIASSANETLYVAELDGQVVATFQTLVTTTMSSRGSSSMVVEAVQTHPSFRGRGIGAQVINFCVEDARGRGMRLIQLTSNAARKDAHRFYERLGFTPSHIGFKLKLK